MNEEIRDVDWARLAAFIDGEGSISTRMVCKVSRKRPNGTFVIAVQISNTDPRLVRWVHSLFGGHVYQGRRTKQQAEKIWKPAWRWEACSRKAYQILVGIEPYSIIKREQIELAL